MKKIVYKLELDKLFLECGYCSHQQIFPDKKDKLHCDGCDEDRALENWFDPIKIDLAMHQDHYNHAMERYEAGIELRRLDNMFKIKDELFLCLAAKFLAASLDPNPQALSASFNLVGLPDLDNKDPAMPPNRAAKETRLGLVPVFTGALRLDPSVRL
jgi:hypothetical protein